MKTVLISIVILIVLIAFFSTIPYEITLREYAPAEIENPFGNWAFPGTKGQPVPGNGEPGKTGQPVPGNGEPGNSNRFAFGAADTAPAPAEPAENATQEYTPITVEVVTEVTEDGQEPDRWGNLEMINYFLCGIAATLIVETIALAIAGVVLEIKYYKLLKETGVK